MMGGAELMEDGRAKRTPARSFSLLSNSSVPSSSSCFAFQATGGSFKQEAYCLIYQRQPVTAVYFTRIYTLAL